ncbi:MAG: lysostaphin resistance A-like protein [Candidatus Korobacteraceae bacterium]|jgi:membrane protease YdiL (CAAX protease family)
MHASLTAIESSQKLSHSAPADTPTQPVAPWWHTVLVLLPIAIMSVAGAYQHGLPNANLPVMSSRLSGYFTVIVVEWFIVLIIWLALKRRGLPLGSLVSGRWQSLKSFFRDLGLGVGLIVVAVPVASGLIHLLRVHTDSTLATIIPHTVFELVVWLGLSITGGYCEELIFRGYLTRQFSGWTGSRAFGIVLQGVAFGLAHGYYGIAMLAIMVHGWLLGLLAYWRKSLRPGMLAHGLQDTLGGVVAFFAR